MRTLTNLGPRIYGLAALAIGFVDLAWLDLAGVWQPLPVDLPDHTPVAVAISLLFLAGGLAMQWRRTAGWAALLVAALYLIFVAGWVRRVVVAPELLATWLGVAEQGAMVLGGLCCWLLAPGRENRRPETFALILRVAFGVCCLVYGAAHFTYPKETAAMVPAWLPPGSFFWAYATGAAHVLAGLALVSGFGALPAARLLTAMFVGFGLLVWVPMFIGAPHAQLSWDGNAVNFALISAAWALAALIQRFPNKQHAPKTLPIQAAA